MVYCYSLCIIVSSLLQRNWVPQLNVGDPDALRRSVGGHGTQASRQTVLSLLQQENAPGKGCRDRRALAAAVLCLVISEGMFPEGAGALAGWPGWVFGASADNAGKGTAHTSTSHHPVLPA